MPKALFKIALTCALFLFISINAYATKFRLGNNHSGIRFSVKFLNFLPITGHFEKFSGSYELDQKNKLFKNIKIEIDANSVKTRNEIRDQHLQQSDFFNSNKFPKITFRSTKVESVATDRYRVTGILNIKGIERKVISQISVVRKERYKKEVQRISLRFEANLNRGDFELEPKELLKYIPSDALLIDQKVSIFGVIASRAEKK